MRKSERISTATAFAVGVALTLSTPSTFAVNSYSVTTIGLTDPAHTQSTTGYRASYVQFLEAGGQVLGTATRFNGADWMGQSVWLYNGADTLEIGLTDPGHTRNDGYEYNSAQALNASGQAIGYADRFNGPLPTGRSVWLYNGTSTMEIGLTDAAHTRNDDYQLNEGVALNASGQALGVAYRYNGTDYSGQSAWLYDGTNTVEIGLTDAEHTRNDGYRLSVAKALNATGQAIGYAERFNGNLTTGQSAWFYRGTNTVEIGLTDAEHTRNDGYEYNSAQALNANGQVLGNALRYSGANEMGQSAWLFNGTSSVEIGLIDAGHTRDDGFRVSVAKILNGAGQAIGYAQRFDGANSTGVSAWLYNGTNTLEIGLTDAVHTRSDGYQQNTAQALNAAGQALGYAERFNGASTAGQSAWVYNGASTVQIGLTDTAHTSDDGYQSNTPLFLNEAGQAVGHAGRFNGASYMSAGQSAWLYDGANTREIGLTDVEHTRSDGYQNNIVLSLNIVGQIVGVAQRYSGAYDAGGTAWFYDSTIDQIYSMDLSISSADGYAYSEFLYLGDDGLGLGTYEYFDSDGSSRGYRAFSFTTENGFLDLGNLIAGGLDDAGWAYLADAIRADSSGHIIGNGLLNDMASGSMGYLLTPQPIPIPPAVWLFGSGLLGLIGTAGRRAARSFLTRPRFGRLPYSS